MSTLTALGVQKPDGVLTEYEDFMHDRFGSLQVGELTPRRTLENVHGEERVMRNFFRVIALLNATVFGACLMPTLTGSTLGMVALCIVVVVRPPSSQTK